MLPIFVFYNTELSRYRSNIVACNCHSLTHFFKRMHCTTTYRNEPLQYYQCVLNSFLIVHLYRNTFVFYRFNIKYRTCFQIAVRHTWLCLSKAVGCIVSLWLTRVVVDNEIVISVSKLCRDFFSSQQKECMKQFSPEDPRVCSRWFRRF